MKAIVLKDFGNVDRFELCELPTPQMGQNDVLVEIKACAFNPIDYQMRQGLGESRLLKSQILGREFSGIVINPGSSNMKVGDAVYAYCGSLSSNGAYASHMAIPEELVAPMPPELNFVQAAAVPMVGLTALQCFERLCIQPWETVFISGGAGGVGCMLIQLLRRSGITRIVTTAGNDRSRQALMKLGLPDEAILDYRGPGLTKRLLEANDRETYHSCIDIVGGRMSEICSSVMQINGKFADIAALTTAECRSQLFDKAATVYNIANYAMAASGDKDGLTYYGSKLAYLTTLFAGKEIVLPEIVNVGGLSASAVAKAHHILENNAANGRRLVMEVR